MKPLWPGLTALVLPLLLTVRIGIPSTAPAPAPSTTPAPKGPTLSGTISSVATGKPLPGARVEIFEQVDADMARARRSRGDLTGDPLSQGSADSSGRFRLAAPPGRRLFVVAQAPGHARSRLGRPLVLPAGSADRDLGRLELPDGRRVTGKVLDPTGKPVAGARVVAHVPPRRAQRGGTGSGFARAFASSGFATPFPVTGLTGADGAFTLDSAATRSLSLRVYADGTAPALVEKAGASGSIIVHLSRGHPLSGKVTAPDGKAPVTGAWVMAGEEGLDGITRSDEKGAFHFEHLRAGKTQIIASAPTSILVVGAAPGETAKDPKVLLADARSTFAPSAPTSVTLPAPADPNAQARSPLLRLRPGGILHARVIDAETREPVAGASLLLDAPGELQARPAITEGPGEVIFAGVPAGNAELRAEADGYLEESVGPAPLASGQTRAISAALRPASALEGTVRDAAGHPVAKATVSVGGPPPVALPIPIPIFFPIGVDPVETDHEGRFVLEKLPSKQELKVSVESPGFAPWEMPGIRLRPGERRSGMEVLLDAGRIITGRVIDTEGKPVGGAGVTATRRREGGPGGMMIRIDRGAGPGRGPGRGGAGRTGLEGDDVSPVLTDTEGLFRVQGARPGVWSLEVKSPGFAPGTAGGLKLEESAASLDAGDIRLEPGAAIRGRVVNGAGEPIPYARGSARKEFTPLGEFSTTEDGSFGIEDLTAGDVVTLMIDAEGYAAVEKGGVAAPADALEITMSAASRVSGRVLDRETRRPIPDFSIAMSRSRGAGGGGMRMAMAFEGPETAFHTEDGAFTIEDVDPGKAAVSARAPGFREFTMRELEIPEGKDLNDLEFLLERSAIVSGTVLDDRGRPLPGAEVRKKESSGGMGFGVRMGAGSGQSAVTDGDGNFLLVDLERGPMTLSFTHADFETADRDIDTSRDVEGLRVTMSHGATLSGIVLREADGSPVSGAAVSAAAAGTDRFTGTKSATTGPDGSFLLESVAAGRYTLRAEATGLRPATVSDLLVAAGASPPPVELRLGGGVTLTGTITGVKESELPRFTVRAMSGSLGGFGTSAAVDASGRFEMKGLSAGTITLLAGSGIFGGKSATKTVEIPDGALTFETTIEFPRGSRVEGSVTRGGVPIEGASVIFMQSSTRATATATTDTSGRYTVEDLDDGEYSVNVMQFTTGLSHATKTTVKGDRQLDIEVPLVKITGFVTDAATGEPIDGATISITKEGGAPVSAGSGFFFQQQAGTDATGYYEIEGLDEGTWTLTARRQGYGYLPRVVTVAPGVAPGEISFELSRVDAFTLRVVDAATGRPPTSLGALVLGGATGDPLSASGTGAIVLFQGRLSADATGAFRLESLQPGRYRVVLGGQGFATETLNDVVVPGPETSMSMGPGGSVEITASGLRTGETARAVLIDASNRPVHLNTYLSEPSFILRPGAPSSLQDIKPGSYRISVSMPAGGRADKVVVIAAGETARVTIP